MKIKFYGRWLYRFIPQPRWLKRWYYRKSFQWWGHPSNNHWKHWLLDSYDLKPGERDIWSGMYSSCNESK